MSRDPGADEEARARHVPRTRTSSAWVGLAVAAVVALALVVFMAQNTERVDITFLWMTGGLSLGLTLFVAVLGSILVTMCLGTARILQLRHLVEGDGRRDGDRSSDTDAAPAVPSGSAQGIDLGEPDSHRDGQAK